MKLLKISRNGLLGSNKDDTLLLRVCAASILTGYFERSVRPLLCIETEKAIVRPTEKLNAQLPARDKFQFAERWAFAGVIDANDDEISVLRTEGGYEIRDLRKTTISEFIAEIAP